MSIWTEIKHALNSTLGTDEFKPLNEIVAGNWNLAVSDSLYMAKTSEISFNETKKTFTYNTKLIFLADGIIKLSAPLQATSSAYQQPYVFNIYEDGILVNSVENYVPVQSTKSSVSLTFNIKKQRVYSFTLERGISNPQSVTPTGELKIYCEPRYAPMLVETLAN